MNENCSMKVILKEIGRFLKASSNEKKIIVKHYINCKKLYKAVRNEIKWGAE